MSHKGTLCRGQAQNGGSARGGRLRHCLLRGRSTQWRIGLVDPITVTQLLDRVTREAAFPWMWLLLVPQEWGSALKCPPLPRVKGVLNLGRKKLSTAFSAYCTAQKDSLYIMTHSYFKKRWKDFIEMDLGGDCLKGRKEYVLYINLICSLLKPHRRP